MDFAYLSTPKGDLYSLGRVGGCKAIASGLLILGSGADELLELTEATECVALAWRDALHDLLQNHRPGRPLRQLDWLGIAAAVDPAWASTHGWEQPLAAATATVNAPPKRGPAPAAS
jgi:hypothetical protein